MTYSKILEEENMQKLSKYDSICSASWGDVDVSTGRAALIVTGKKAGSTSIKINLIVKVDLHLLNFEK